MANETPETELASWSPIVWITRGIGAWTRFWFTPIDPTGLHCLRFLSGLLFLAWLLPLFGDYSALFGLDGFFGTEAYKQASQLPGGSPYPIGWSLIFLFGNPGLFLWFSIAVLILFTLGVATRITGVLTWLVVVSHTANPALHYDADYLLMILAFYLMIGHLFLGQFGQQQSPIGLVAGTADLLTPFRRVSVAPSHAANLAVRLIQVNFAIIIVTSAFHKLQFAEWWTGVAFWYSLHPPREMSIELLRDLSRTANPTLFCLSLAAYATLAWQFAFPLFAFRPRWRPLLLIGAVAGWLGSASIFRLPYFGPVYMIACLSLLSAREWAWILNRSPSVAGPAQEGVKKLKFRPRVGG